MIAFSATVLDIGEGKINTLVQTQYAKGWILQECDTRSCVLTLEDCEESKTFPSYRQALIFFIELRP